MTRNGNMRVHLALATIVATAAAVPVRGQVNSTWTGGAGDGQWSNDANWVNNPPQGGYPNNGNQGFNYEGNVSGNILVTLSEPITLDFFSLSHGAFVTGGTTLTSTGPAVFGEGSNGFLDGGGTFEIEDSVFVIGELRIDDWTVSAKQINVGTGVPIGSVRLDGNAMLSIETGLDFLRDGSLFSFAGSTATVELGGRLEKSGGGGLSTVGIRLMSEGGTIANLTPGEVRLVGVFPSEPGATLYDFNNTLFEVTGGGSIRFAGFGDDQIVALNGNTTVNGTDGYVEFASGTIRATGTISSMPGQNQGSLRLASSAVSWTGGTLDMHPEVPFVMEGSELGDVVNKGAFRWEGGHITGPFRNENTTPDVARIAADAVDVQLINTTFDNCGHFRIGTLLKVIGTQDDVDAPLFNAGGATLVLDGGSLSADNSYAGHLINSGTIVARNLPSPSTDELRVTLNASSILRVESTEFRATGGPPLDCIGQWTFESGSTVELVDGATLRVGACTVIDGPLLIRAFGAGNVFSQEGKIVSPSSGSIRTAAAGGGGEYRLKNGMSGEFQLDGDPSVPIVFETGAITFGEVTNVGAFLWRGGKAGGFVNMAVSNARTDGDPETLREPNIFVNKGVFMQKHELTGGPIYNREGAVWIMGSTNIFADDLIGFKNEGTLRKVDPGPATIEVRLNNRSVVEVLDGQLIACDVDQYHPGTRTLRGGTWRVAESDDFIDPPMLSFCGPIEIIKPEAKIESIGTASSFSGLESLTLNEGSLGASGGADMGFDNPIENTGELEEGDIVLAPRPPTTITMPHLTNEAPGTVTVSGDAILDIATAFELLGGNLRGDGTVIVPLLTCSGGTVAPGAPPEVEPDDTTGTLFIDGAYAQQAPGTLTIELGGLTPGDFDQLVITGGASLAGAIDVAAADDFVPRHGDSLTILSASSVTGAFDTVISDLRGLHVVIDASSVRIEFTCPGDLDGDDNVGFSDLLAVLTAWGACAGCPEDVDGDDNVGFSDLLAVLTAWGSCR